MHSMQGYADAWILSEESCGQCIVCSGMHSENGQDVVCNYEEGTRVSNDDENDGFRRAHENPKGSLAPQGRATGYSIETCDKSDVT